VVTLNIIGSPNICHDSLLSPALSTFSKCGCFPSFVVYHHLCVSVSILALAANVVYPANGWQLQAVLHMIAKFVPIIISLVFYI
jgi:hypothetical protein